MTEVLVKNYITTEESIIVNKVNGNIGAYKPPKEGVSKEEESKFTKLVTDGLIRNDAVTGRWMLLAEVSDQPQSSGGKKKSKKESTENTPQTDAEKVQEDAQNNQVPEVQKSGYTADELAEVVKRANKGESLEGDQQILK